MLFNSSPGSTRLLIQAFVSIPSIYKTDQALLKTFSFFFLSVADTNLNIIYKMKCTMMFALFAAILVAVCALPFDHKVRRPPPRGGVSFPGYGSFNPRGRRSPYDSRVGVGKLVGREGNVQVDVQQKIYEGKNGHAEIYGSASKTPDRPAQADAGVGGEITWGSEREGPTFEEIDRIRTQMKIN